MTARNRRVVRAVIDRLGQAAAFPESGRMVPEFETPWLREFIMPPYRVVRRVDSERVRVVRVV